MERTMLIVAVVLSAVGLTANTCGQESQNGDELKKKYPLLARLDMPKDSLPPGCSKPDLQPDDFPVKGLRQSAITTDARAIAALDKVVRVEAENTQAVYFAVYKEAGELGVIGWAFATEEVAKDAHQNVTKRGRAFKIWRQGKYLITLWRDTGTTDRCMQQMAENIEAIVRRSDADDR
ncbi:MAG: hypothetical protein HZA46_14700 [Planctomycetales bacterium]|nr:hypothetical protein [Planctomycetales bacterium]